MRTEEKPPILKNRNPVGKCNAETIGRCCYPALATGRIFTWVNSQFCDDLEDDEEGQSEEVFTLGAVEFGSSNRRTGPSRPDESSGSLPVYRVMLVFVSRSRADSFASRISPLRERQTEELSSATYAWYLATRNRRPRREGRCVAHAASDFCRDLETKIPLRCVGTM